MKLIKNWPTALLHADSMIGVILLWMTALGPVMAVTFWRDTNPVTWIIWALIMPPLVLFLRVRDQGIATGTRRRRWPATLAKYLLVLAVMLGSVLYTSRVHAMEGGASPALTTGQATEAETVEFCRPIVARFEGIRLQAYIPVPGDRPTICFGATHIGGKPVTMGMTATRAQCDALLDEHLREYRAGMHRYWTDETKRERLPVSRDCAFTSFPINVGIRGAGNSTAAKRLNAGWIEGACAAMLWWNKSGGVIYRGLVVRREEEAALCLSAL